MSDKPKGLLDGGPKSALDEGAARFDRLIESVKLQQAAPKDAAPVRLNPLMAEGPDETWARQFRSAAIGADPRSVLPPDFMTVPRPALAAETGLPKADALVSRPQMPTTGPQVAAPDIREHMGARIGKPARKRSWLARLAGRGGR